MNAPAPRRCIRLRRPPSIVPTEPIFLPELDEAGRARVERRWTALCAANPAYFDGQLLHVVGVHRNGHGGAVLHVAACAYRYHAVQDEACDLGVRPLGVKGVVRRGPRVLMGRRSERVASYGGLWECAPGGVVEPDEAPETTVVKELLEETGLRAIAPPVARAILYDPILRTWEIVYDLAVDPGAEPRPTPEYDTLGWFAAGERPVALTPLARAMIEQGLA